MPKKDLNQLAFDVVRRATGEVVASESTPEEDALAAARREGGIKGGAARAKLLSAGQRSAIAKKAALTRWKKAHGRQP